MVFAKAHVLSKTFMRNRAARDCHMQRRRSKPARAIALEIPKSPIRRRSWQRSEGTFSIVCTPPHVPTLVTGLVYVQPTSAMNEVCHPLPPVPSRRGSGSLSPCARHACPDTSRRFAASIARWEKHIKHQRKTL